MTTWQNQRWADASLQNGKYILRKKLGMGVFSATYLGNDQHLNRPVVLKTLTPALQSHPDYPQFKRQFQEAALKLQQCQHPHLVSAIDYFEEYDLPFLVMDYVPGQTGAELLAAGIVLTPVKAVRCIRQLGAALQIMHDHGLRQPVQQRDQRIACWCSREILLEHRAANTLNGTRCISRRC